MLSHIPALSGSSQTPESPPSTQPLLPQLHYRSAAATLDTASQPSQQRQAPSDPVYVTLVAWANRQHSLRAGCYLCASRIVHYVAGQAALQRLVRQLSLQRSSRGGNSTEYISR